MFIIAIIVVIVIRLIAVKFKVSLPSLYKKEQV
ncbi:MAG: putative membrane protein YeiH [Psychroserpens sp.]